MLQPVRFSKAACDGNPALIALLLNMLRDDPLILPSRSEEDMNVTGPSMAGRIVYERFLIERETGDRGGNVSYASYIAKDLKNYCRRVILTSLTLPSDVSDTESPSYNELCNILIEIGHPNIGSFLESGKLFDGRPYSVSSYIRGERLSKILRNGRRLTVRKTGRILEAVYEALAAVHARNVLHCAVNPNNVVIENFDGVDEVIRLINFGTAWPVGVRSLRNGEDYGVEEGALCFAAPETLFALSHRSPASDVYSLSALAYRLLTGKVPFPANDREELLASISLGVLELPSDIRTDLSRETERLILSGLRAESVGRPQDIADLGARLVLSLEPPAMPAAYRVEKRHQPEVAPTSRSTEEISEETPELEPVGEEILVTRKRTSLKTQAAFSDRAITWSLIVLLLAGALSIPIGQVFLQEGTKAAAVNSIVTKGPENKILRQIKYQFGSESLPQGRQPAGSSSVDRALLSLTADTAGELYILEELAEQNSPVAFRIISPATGTPAVQPGQPIRSELMSQRGSGTAKAIWIVWSAEKNAELSAARSAENANTFAGDDARKLKHFLERNRDLRVGVTNDGVTGQVTLASNAERIVHRINVEPVGDLTAQK